jgi:ribonuclease I
MEFSFQKLFQEMNGRKLKARFEINYIALLLVSLEKLTTAINLFKDSQDDEKNN